MNIYFAKNHIFWNVSWIHSQEMRE